MTPVFELHFDCLELSHHPLLRRLAPYDERSILPALPAIMRETQKREGIRFSLSPLLSILCGEPPKLDQSRLLRMQFQTKLRQAFPEFFQELFRLRSALEAHHQIVGIPDDNDIAPSHFPALGFDPQIEYVMQVDVRQQR